MFSLAACRSGRVVSIRKLKEDKELQNCSRVGFKKWCHRYVLVVVSDRSWLLSETNNYIKKAIIPNKTLTKIKKNDVQDRVDLETNFTTGPCREMCNIPAPINKPKRTPKEKRKGRCLTCLLPWKTKGKVKGKSKESWKKVKGKPKESQQETQRKAKPTTTNTAPTATNAAKEKRGRKESKQKLKES